MEHYIVVVNGLIWVCHHGFIIVVSGHQCQDDVSGVMSILFNRLETIFLNKKLPHDLPTLRMWRLTGCIEDVLRLRLEFPESAKYLLEDADHLDFISLLLTPGDVVGFDPDSDLALFV